MSMTFMWLPIVVIAYFLNAVAAVVDKFLISKKIPNPAVYTFYITIWGLLAVVLAPWGFGWHGWGQFFANMVGGAAFALALLCLFKALFLNDSSRITPFIGGLSPVMVLMLSFLFLGERLGWAQILAFILIVSGTVLISLGHLPGQGKNGFGLAFLSALLFAISYVISKYVYLHQNFISGFIWMRFGVFLGTLLILIPRANYQAVKESWHVKDIKVGVLFFFGQIVGALGFILISYAISLTSVTLVNALQSLQYVFLLAMVLILAKWRPQILEEKVRGKILAQKIIAIVLIGGGLYLLI